MAPDDLDADAAAAVSPDEFDELFAANYERLVRALTVISGSREAAADAVQEAFVKAHLRWGRVARLEDPVSERLSTVDAAWLHIEDATNLMQITGLVWFVMGLVCKVLNLVPRHREIVASILGEDIAPVATVAIGLGEIAIAVWIWSGRFPRLVAVLQMGLVGVMNVLEFFLAPGLLMWGHWNALFAALFIAFVGWQEFVLRPRAEART